MATRQQTLSFWHSVLLGDPQHVFLFSYEGERLWTDGYIIARVPPGLKKLTSKDGEYELRPDGIELKKERDMPVRVPSFMTMRYPTRVVFDDGWERELTLNKGKMEREVLASRLVGATPSADKRLKKLREGSNGFILVDARAKAVLSSATRRGALLKVNAAGKIVAAVKGKKVAVVVAPIELSVVNIRDQGLFDEEDWE